MMIHCNYTTLWSEEHKVQYGGENFEITKSHSLLFCLKKSI